MGKNDLFCDNECIHEDVVNQVRSAMPPAETIADLADFFKVFGDSTRLHILSALDCHEMCVCDIASLLNMTISAVSHQLRFLRNVNLVKNRRDGKVVYYSLADEHVRTIIDCGAEHIAEKKEN